MPFVSDTTFESTDYSLRNRLYSVIVRQDQGNYEDDSGRPRVVVGSLPASFQIDQQVVYAPVWNGEGIIPTRLQSIAAVMGKRAIAQIGTMQVWQGQGDLEFTLEFEFRAWSNPEKDVMQPIKNLLAMTLPFNRDNGLMQSPGAYLPPKAGKALVEGLLDGDFGALTSKTAISEQMVHKVSLSIGRWLYFDNIFITGVQHTINGQTPFRGLGTNYFSQGGELAELEGVPQSASVVLSFRPAFMLTENDIDRMFADAQGTSSNLGPIIDNSDFVFNDDQVELVDLYDPLAT